MKNEKLIKEIPDSYNRLFGGELAGFKFSREDEREKFVYNKLTYYI